MTFLYFITCYKYSIKKNFKRDFTKPSFKHAKTIFLFVAFLYSLSIDTDNMGATVEGHGKFSLVKEDNFIC